MMNSRNLVLILITLFLTIALGCSSDQTNPIESNSPGISGDTFFEASADVDGKTISTFTATFDLENDSVDIAPDRDSMGHINVTPYIPAPTIVINSYNSTTGIVDVDFTIFNPYKIDAYDPRVIIYTDAIGHMLTNADDWTGLFDIAGGLPINPFKAFVKTVPMRLFDEKTYATENLLIYLPGGNPSVHFAIEISWPGNCEEPYEINNFQQGILYDYTGASCSIELNVQDWQSDTDTIYLYCPALTGGSLVTLVETDPDHWLGNISNFTASPAAIYYGYIAAYSGGVALYDKVPIVVTHYTTGCLLYVDDDNVSGPWDGTPAHPYQYVQDAVDNAVDNCTIWIRPGTYNEDLGGISSSGLAEVTVTNLQNLTFHGEGMPVIVLHPYYDTGRAAIHAYDSHGLTIEGIEFTPGHAYQSAIWLENCDNALVQDCKITPAPASGFLEFFRGQGCDGLTVQRNELDDIRSVSTFSHEFVLNNCTDAVVTLNNCRRLIHGGSNIYQTGMAYVGCFNSTNVEISKNIFGEVDRTADSENYVQLRVFYISGGSDVTIRNNLVYDLSFFNSHHPAALSNNWGVYASNSGNIQIYNNTFDQLGPSMTGTGSTYGIDLQNCINASVYNNILTNLSNNSDGECYGVYSTLACTIDYSDIWILSAGTTSTYGGLAVGGPNMLVINPNYADPMNYDYHLGPGSPCISTGMSGQDMGCYGGSDPLP